MADVFGDGMRWEARATATVAPGLETRQIRFNYMNHIDPSYFGVRAQGNSRVAPPSTASVLQ